jgi:hypothetical protein
MGSSKKTISLRDLQKGRSRPVGGVAKRKMTRTMSFIKRYWKFILLGFVVIFLYTTNLDKNSRFIWDESRALVDMHRIWEQKQITFVGPISENNLEMFPSLSYYMYMPATVLTNFDPLGPSYMAAFYGLIAWLLLTLTIIKSLGVTKKALFLSLLIASLQPVMTASRWAWNPNPVIFWMSLFVFSLSFKNPFLILLGGVSLGASLYHHYLAALGVIPAILLLPLVYKDSKEIIKKIGLTLAGFVFAIIPFALFELKNHYFLNSGAFLSANEKSFVTLSITGFFERFWNAIVVFSTMFVPNNLIIIVLFLVTLIFIYSFYRKDKLIRYSFFSLLISLLLFGFVTITYPHYQFSQVPLATLFLLRFFYLNNNIFGKLLLALLLIISLTSALSLIKSYTWQGDIEAVRNVTKHLLNESNPKANVAALASPDNNLYGQRFRDMALINGKLLYAFDKYPQSEVLYVVSGTDKAEILRKDQAWEIESFKGSTITNTWKVSDYPLYLYRFEKL